MRNFGDSQLGCLDLAWPPTLCSCHPDERLTPVTNDHTHARTRQASSDLTWPSHEHCSITQEIQCPATCAKCGSQHAKEAGSVLLQALTPTKSCSLLRSKNEAWKIKDTHPWAGGEEMMHVSGRFQFQPNLVKTPAEGQKFNCGGYGLIGFVKDEPALCDNR